MIECNETFSGGRHFFKVCRLYLSAFPKIERHTLRELFSASARGDAEFLRFSENGKFIGLAYMIVRGESLSCCISPSRKTNAAKVMAAPYSKRSKTDMTARTWSFSSKACTKSVATWI